MAKLEQGQRAYEAYAEALRSKSFFITPWEKLEGCSRYGFAAVEQACAVPASTDRAWLDVLLTWASKPGNSVYLIGETYFANEGTLPLLSADEPEELVALLEQRAATEQACAVPAATQGGKARVELAESIISEVLGYLALRGAIDAACATWGASVHQEVRRELTGKVNDALAAEAGKAQAEWVSINDELPKLFELVQFATPESAGPTLGKFNGVRWMALFDLSRPGLIDYGRGQVSHWRRLPPPPSAPEGT